MSSTLGFFLPTINGGPSLGNPAIFPNTVYNAAAGQVAMVLGAKGPTSTATAMHAAGASALCMAYDLLRAGRADAILCPAVDELPPGVLDVYRALGLFSGPAANRYTLAEGGVAVLLERESAARARGARMLGELAGHATASDAMGIGRWDPPAAVWSVPCGAHWPRAESPWQNSPPSGRTRPAWPQWTVQRSTPSPGCLCRAAAGSRHRSGRWANPWVQVPS